MARKPYTHTQPDNWYLANHFYKCYMLRELTSVTTALIALNLFYGIAALAGTPESWAGWIAWQRNPLMLLINLLGCLGAWYNSKTWFEAMPKAIRIPKGDKFVPDYVLIRGSWAAFVGIFIVLWMLVAYFA